MVEFWTYGCYNCRNVLPHLRTWHETYADQGLTIIGVHYPEFDRERDVDTVNQALVDLNITILHFLCPSTTMARPGARMANGIGLQRI